MKTGRSFTVVALAAVSILGLGSTAHAQRVRVVIPPPVVRNPNYYLPDGTNLNQYAYNVSVLGKAYSQIPPYILGYNPYQPNYYGNIYPLPQYPTAPICLPPQYVPGSIASYNPAFLNPGYYTNPFFSFLGNYP
jgi:hypothetical protein